MYVLCVRCDIVRNDHVYPSSSCSKSTVHLTPCQAIDLAKTFVINEECFFCSAGTFVINNECAKSLDIVCYNSRNNFKHARNYNILKFLKKIRPCFMAHTLRVNLRQF